jgi:hypothetical protein
MDPLSEILFNTHPDIETLYFTSDGYAFLNSNDAESHAAKLEDKQIDIIDKSMFDANPEPEEDHL